MGGDKEEKPLAMTGSRPQRIAAATKPKVKKAPINRSKLGPDYVAPDGGHGWLVALAAGCSNVSILIIEVEYLISCR